MGTVPARLGVRLALLSQAGVHHAPCEVLHALLVRQALLCLGEEAPDLCGKRVFTPQILWAGGHSCNAVIKAGEGARLGQLTPRTADGVVEVEPELLQSAAHGCGALGPVACCCGVFEGAPVGVVGRCGGGTGGLGSSGAF